MSIAAAEVFHRKTCSPSPGRALAAPLALPVVCVTNVIDTAVCRIGPLIAFGDVGDQNVPLFVFHDFENGGDRRPAVVEGDGIYGLCQAVRITDTDDMLIVRYTDEQLSTLGICESHDGRRK